MCRPSPWRDIFGSWHLGRVFAEYEMLVLKMMMCCFLDRVVPQREAAVALVSGFNISGCFWGFYQWIRAIYNEYWCGFQRGCVCVHMLEFCCTYWIWVHSFPRSGKFLSLFKKEFSLPYVHLPSSGPHVKCYLDIRLLAVAPQLTDVLHTFPVSFSVFDFG